MRIIGGYLKKYTLKTHIILISTAILLITFACIITYSYQKNAKSITDVSLGLLKSAQESVKQSMYSVYLDPMNFVNYGFRSAKRKLIYAWGYARNDSKQ